MNWADFNPFEPAVRADPWPHLHALRAAAPVLRTNLGFWLLSRHRDCDAVLRDPRFGHRAGGGGDEWQRQGHELAHDHQGARLLILATIDPPEHTRLRGALTRVVTARSIAALEPLIRRTVDDSIDSIDRLGPFDLMDAVAEQLPLTVMGELLGIDAEDRTRFATLSRNFIGGLDHDSSVDADAVDRRRQANADFMKRFAELAAERRLRPGTDLLSRLSTAGGLTDDELFGLCAFLFVAGLETTRGLIGNAVLALLHHPDQRRHLGSDVPDVEEFIRYDTSSPITARTALTDVDLDGHRVRRGELVILLLNAANRDPAAFADPDRLDLTRPDSHRHLGFGAGIHYCLGAWLARLETRIVLARLAERVPGLALAGEPRYQPSGVHRTLAELPVTA